MLGNFSCFWCRLLTIYKIDFFKKIFQEDYHLIQIRTQILSVLIVAKLFAKAIIVIC